MKYKIHLVPIVIFLLTLFYFVVVRSRPFDASTTSNSFAVASTLVIGICFLLGPLSRFRPKKFLGLLKYRKALGLWGFAMAAIHVMGAFVLEYNSDILAAYSPANENFWALVAGTIAFIIFFIMAWTSRAKYMKSMGYEKWKKLQRTGYIAFFFVLVHFGLVNNSSFIGRQLGQFLLAFVMIVLLARVAMVIMGKKEAYKKEDFHEVHEMEKPE